MTVDNSPDVSKNEIDFFKNHTISVLITSGFLVVWLFCQWGVNQVIEWLVLSAILDQLMLRTFQIIFAVTTLIPVTVYYYVDITVAIIRARQKIEIQKRNLPRNSGQVNDSRN